MTTYCRGGMFPDQRHLENLVTEALTTPPPVGRRAVQAAALVAPFPAAAFLLGANATALTLLAGLAIIEVHLAHHRIQASWAARRIGSGAPTGWLSAARHFDRQGDTLRAAAALDLAARRHRTAGRRRRLRATAARVRAGGRPPRSSVELAVDAATAAAAVALVVSVWPAMATVLRQILAQ
jgi:hypothetical protein